ncbi:HHIP-like protein 1, partial [Toxocara canis]
DKAFYGLNVTNSVISNNTGNGIFAKDIRERITLSNVTIIDNEGFAGILVHDGAADIWINATNIERNWGDGLNVIITWIELIRNQYHPSIEIHSCQSDGVAKTLVDISGNRIEGGYGVGFRMEPAVNTMVVISSNQFLNNNNTALLIRNARHPQLAHLPAQVNPFAAVCNQRNPHITTVQQYYRSFRKESEPYVLGGTIWENEDLGAGRYTVIDDLNVVPGARLTISPGTVFEFSNGVGMLVQVTAGRLEVYVNGQWGTICNRSWTQDLARLACNQLGLIMDSEYFENWRIFPSSGSLPIIMDNIRCEEREYDLTRCRHDGVTHNVASSCASTEVVGK